MTVAIAFVLAVAAFTFIALPFFRQRVDEADPVADETSQELLFKRDTVFSMLKELEFDHQSGILSDKDYRELEDRYKKKGIAILKDMDSLEQTGVLEEVIERQVSQMRQGKASSPSSPEEDIEERVAKLRKNKPAAAPDEIEKRVSELRQQPKKVQFCTQCGAKRKPEDRFCAQCGAQLL